VVEVHCACPAAEAARRCAERAATTHPVHVVRELSPEVLAQDDRPLGYGPHHGGHHASDRSTGHRRPSPPSVRRGDDLFV